MTDRPTTRIGGVVLEEFSHPQLSPTGTTRTAKHQLLPTEPDGDGDTVTQHLGNKARTFRLKGDCYESTATDLHELLGEEVSLRHALWSGTVYVSDDDFSPQGAKDEQGWRYTYTLDLVEVV